MLKFTRRISLSTFALRNRYLFSTEADDLTNQLISDKKQGNDTLPKITYGLEMNKHLFPHNKLHFLMHTGNPQQNKLFLPNYLVILIRKVIDNAGQIKTQSEKQKQSQSQQKPQHLLQQFYNIATYCKIKSNQNTIQIEGISRVKINKIQKINQIDLQKHQNEQRFSEKAQDNPKITLQKFKQNQNDQLQEKDRIFNNKNVQKIESQYYSLDIEEYSEPEFQINHQIQIKFKYLIIYYASIFQNNEKKSKFLLFNPNQIISTLYSMTQYLSEQNTYIKQSQEILQQQDINQRMILIQNLLTKIVDWTYVFKEFERVLELNFRSRKFYEWYSEFFKLVKQKMEGKSGKQLFLSQAMKEFYEKKPPQAIEKVFLQEKQKYMQIEQNSAEAPIIKKYLEELSKIPYSIKSEEILDLQYAQKVLDEDHYGMKEVKDTILQIIAVGKLKGSLKGKILCLIGPPGLGKTTIAKSIAKALGRKFYNISLGGVTDSSVLKGHRRTYVAAYSGKIISALKVCQTSNPVILLDEIDKMGRSHQGDPRSQLLQILDPSQNHSFFDNYLDVPVNISDVLFICSANYQNNISKPLLDRMEKIRLSSYTDDEKKNIFSHHLMRRALEKSGVPTDKFIIKDDVVDALIYEYSRGQPGVRRLEKNTEKILQSVAYKIVSQEQQLPIKVSRQNLKDYLGVSLFNLRNHNEIGIGMAISLGGGDYGSRLTYIQSFKKSFAKKSQYKRGVMYTGSLGDVFKQAMSISYTYAKRFLLKKLNNRYLFENEIHIHAPDGASKKDGSTDSLTICSSLISLALKKQVRKGIAMTGEITLHGKILRTTEIKQKILLAKRQRIFHLIIPAQNEPQVQIIDDSVKQGFTFYFVGHFEQVYSLLFQYQSQIQQNQTINKISQIKLQAIL